ncbi:putative nuclease HARBI1 [Cinnamomum micranthum f. kanehirae]|uniref:Putative nuclease HARBI1 n=1 Tax=Cinnamomum micranthum f. kanehirae TaxID=337451 RepID=A0A3S3MUX5_9MAGN|nr:putative nuclease HARBI1 [Cinnamomum micranthum f. kanehirae]
MEYQHLVFNIIANDSSSSSNDEVEIIIRLAIEKERLNSGEGSRPHRHCTVIKRDFLQANIERIFLDYFADSPVFSPNLFRRSFRMSRSLFLRIQSVLEANGPYFVQRRNNAGRLGLSSFQKMIAAIRLLAYGGTADLCDEYLRIGESTALKSLKKFVEAVITNFSKECLRSPNNNDIAKLLAEGESRGFPGMLGSIDCMHWKWKNCPTAWQGSHNDINVLERSFVFTELAEGHAPLVNYSINDERHLNDVERVVYEQLNETPCEPVSSNPILLENFIEKHRCIRNRETHSQLQSDLVEHLWLLHSEL